MKKTEITNTSHVVSKLTIKSHSEVYVCEGLLREKFGEKSSIFL